VAVADEDTPEAEPAAAPAGDGEARRRCGSRAPTAAAVALICGLLAVSGYLFWHHHAATQHREQTAAFAAAAEQELINLTSFDFNNAKADVQRVLDNSTGEFKDDFGKRADDFTAVVEQSKVVTKGRVNAVAVESMDNDSAVVLVAAVSNVTNSAGADDDPRSWRMRMTVSREGDQYKVSKVEMVP
jgi:Mce-associated membrane protein